MEGYRHPVRVIGSNLRGILCPLLVIDTAIGVANSQSSDAVASLLFGAGSVVLLPVFYGILHFVLGLITALLYNLVGWLGGGIQVELEVTQRPGSTTYQP